MTYLTHTFSNGLRVVHLPHKSPVSYCGVIVNVGSRDESRDEHGMAHLVEHMLFKGTPKRKSRQIIDRLENIGGELNAYTSKEETVVYAGFLTPYTERAIELIADIVQHSTFPKTELEKEIVIVQDEIESYNDSPSELIFDDFEELMFDHNPMAHNILGTKKSLKSFSAEKLSYFFQKNYTANEIVFFSLGNADFSKIVRWCEKYFANDLSMLKRETRLTPEIEVATVKAIKRKTNQVHCLMGARAYDFHHADRLALYVLNNILGGPGMSSLLNLSLRERNGLVYTVESNYQPFTDCGWWAVYFGTDAANAHRCEALVKKEIEKLCHTPLSAQKLNKYKLQLTGQMAIASENKENVALSLGKSLMRYGYFDTLEEVKEKVYAITAEQLQRVANEVFDINNLTVLKYV